MTALGIAAITVAVANVVIAFVLAGVLRSVLRSSARERDLMLNQIMHLSGRTWQEPPRMVEILPEDTVATLVFPDQYPV